MKSRVVLCIIFLCVSLSIFAQKQALSVQKIVLDNGFTVFLNEDKSAKEVYGAVVVKAGSKNDPADATGMAHYLEHLLFKGTTELGTSDYLKEKPFLDSINIYYDLLGKTNDKVQRKKIQQLINNQSVQASKYALPTEFDKLIKSIGGTNLNAFTDNDMTVYHNSFPASQIEKWLDLYSHRFQKPVFRSFQSELEVVYEEKNISIDDFSTKLLEEIQKNLFKFHPYGTQTTLGTTEHLKNPSLNKMYDFFNTYYVANNMGLVLCGNFNSEAVIPIIKDKFSKLKSGVIPPFPKFPETLFSQKKVLKVRYTPIKVELVGFKTVSSNHPDKPGLDVLISMLSNETETGRLNKLQRDGKFMVAGSFNFNYNDDGALVFFIVPKIIGQSFTKVEKLLFAEIQDFKNGVISDKELQMNKIELYRQRQQDLERYEDRSLSIVEAFSQGTAWEDFLQYSQQVEKVSKEDIKRLAEKYFTPNYLSIRSRTGFPRKKTLQKPGFKTVATTQKEESAFAKKFKELSLASQDGKYLDFENDSKFIGLNESNSLYVTKNPINDIFSLKIIYKIGTDSIPKLNLAGSLFSNFHINEMDANKLKEEFALLGITYYCYSSNDRFTIGFTGLDKNLQKSLELINKILINPLVDDKAVKSMIGNMIPDRKIENKDPGSLGYALGEYVRLGKESPFLKRPSIQELKELKGNELLQLFKRAITYNAVWHYSGNETPENVKELMFGTMVLANNRKEIPLSYMKVNVPTENTIYVVNDKKAVQSQVRFFIPSAVYNSSPALNASSRAFNEYMNGGFSGLVMQEIREFRSLAYSTSGYLETPKLPNRPAFFRAYIGCQSDKSNEAIEVMLDLIRNMPLKPERINPIKDLLEKSNSSRYPDFRDISSSIENLKQRGYKSDPFSEEVKQYSGLKFDDIVALYNNFIKDRPIQICIYGNMAKIDQEKLSKFGKIVKLDLADIMVK